MSRGLNKVMIMGNLGADPEVRYIPAGGAVTSIRVATSESWKDKQTGEKQERTEWHRVTLFNRIGEIAAQYLRKGSRVFIEGSLRTHKWQDPNGNDRYSTDIIASSMQLMDSKGAGGTGGGGGASFDETDMPPAEGQSQDHLQARAPMGASTKAPAKAATTLDEDFDDGIPF